MWSPFDRDVPARRRETRIPSFQVLDVGSRCLFVRGLYACVGVLHMLHCTVAAMEKDVLLPCDQKKNNWQIMTIHA